MKFKAIKSRERRQHYAGGIHTEGVNWNSHNRGDLVEQRNNEDQLADHKRQRAALIDQIREDQEG